MDAERIQFHEMGLDDRLLKAVADLGWSQPTLIQEKAIPLALEGKDLLARARTGSGKTAAYAIPVLQRILSSKQSVREQDVRALVLVPTKELGQQVQTMMRQLSSYCSRDVRVADISGKADVSTQRPILMEKPDVVVGTPSRVLAHLNAQNLLLHSSLEMLVVDEADLVFSFGFESDLKNLLCHLPKIYQSFLMSATFNEDVQALKELLLHNPVILKLQGSQLPDRSQLQQFAIRCEEEDKFLLIYTLLKLQLLRGKSLLFVGAVDRSYRLKLFLEQFGIPACVLNSELPVQSRSHIITQFNQGFYDIIIATDEQSLLKGEGPSKTAGKRKTKKKKSSDGAGKCEDQEYGVSRGVDFQNLSNVINFDFPTTVDSYIHRVGRTARADNPGTALSFIAQTELSLLSEVEEALGGGTFKFGSHYLGSSVGLFKVQFDSTSVRLSRLHAFQMSDFTRTEVMIQMSLAADKSDVVLKPYEFKMDEIEGFRYRCRDAMRAVTKQAVKEARLKEIKQELLNSEKLKTYFEDNPRDLQLLRHDRDLHPAVIKPHMKNVPDYLVPTNLKAVINPLSVRRKRRPISRPEGLLNGRFKRSAAGRNPLRSFRYAGAGRRKGKAS